MDSDTTAEEQQSGDEESYASYMDMLHLQLRLGGIFEKSPPKIGTTQKESEGVYGELGLQYFNDSSTNFSTYVDARAYGSTAEFSTTNEDIDTGRVNTTSDSNNYLRLREFWIRYKTLTPYPGEYITLGLQRLKGQSGLWWDSDIESLTWTFDTTRFKLKLGTGERFDTYRTNTELSDLEKDKLRFFGEFNYDWRAYHQLNLRVMYADQYGDAIADYLATGAPDGVNGQWLWSGIGLSSNWLERRSPGPFAYNAEFISLTGNSDFLNQDGVELEDHDIRAWAVDAGVRYDLSRLPMSMGVAYAQGSGGFDENESNMFVQTGLNSNKDHYAGNDIELYRFGEALRPDLTNLIQETLFASYTYKKDYQLAGSMSYYQRHDTAIPIYQNATPLEMDSDSSEVGTGYDLVFRHDINTTVLHVPVKYWQVRCSTFLPGEAFDESSDETLYRVTLDFVGRF